MLYKILAKLFDHNEFQGEERVRHSHLIYPLLTMATGSSLWFQKGLEILGTLIVILGFGMGISMLLCINWDKVIAYWMTINEHVVLMNKSNPDLWVALGYSAPAKTVEVIEKSDDLNHWKISQVPVSPSIMNQVGNKVIYNLSQNGSLEFTEEMYGSLIPNFRKQRKKWIEEGKLVPKNSKNKKNGYRLSKKGYTMFYEFASDHMKLKEGD